MLLGHLGRRGGDDDVGAASAGELVDLLHDVHLGAVDGPVRAGHLRRHRQPLGVDVDEVDLPGLVHAAGDTDVHAPDRSGPEDDDDVARLDPEQLLGVDGAGERLGRGGLVEADVVRDPVEPVDLEHLAGDDHVLGEAALVLVAHRGLVLTHRHPALATLVALAARYGGDDLDAVADLPVGAVQAGDVGADLDDLAGDLMPDGARRAEVLVPVVEDLDVGAAGGAVPHADLHLVRAAGRLRVVLEAHVLGRVEAQGLHRYSQRSAGVTSDAVTPS